MFYVESNWLSPQIYSESDTQYNQPFHPQSQDLKE